MSTLNKAKKKSAWFQTETWNPRLCTQ